MKIRPSQIVTRAGLCLIALTGVGTGCATAEQAAIQKEREAHVASLQTRLEESERVNGRMTVRIEELEDQVFLLQDRVEANRISLQRRGYMRPAAQQQMAQAPQPTSETYYGGQYYQPQPQQQSQRNITRIPIGPGAGPGYYGDPEPQPAQQGFQQRQDFQGQNTAAPVGGEAEAEVVITEREYLAFTGEDLSAKRRTTTNDGAGRTKSAQPNVTEEKLPTTAELKDQSVSQLEKPATAADSARKKDTLSLYKDALAEYRSGNYAAALKGFQAFLDAKPRADYVDNALYWLGECQFGLGEYQKSVDYFQRVMREQPDGNKVPDSMLKMSLALERMGRPGDAQQLLQTLTSQYPATNAGKLGHQKLNGAP